MSQFIKFYFTSSVLNMFRTLIHPSPGACDFSILSPHWLCVLVSMCWSFVVAGWGGIRVVGWNFSLPHGYHPNQPHRNSNTHRNKNTQPMWWYKLIFNVRVSSEELLCCWRNTVSDKNIPNVNPSTSTGSWDNGLVFTSWISFSLL